MKVVHIESGLGNQMLCYCNYLATKQANPNDDVYVENIIFDIKESHKVVSHWNGYELEKVFGIHAPNVRDILTAEQWEQIDREIRQREFWNHNWNYGVHFSQAFTHAGLPLGYHGSDLEAPGARPIVFKPDTSWKGRLKTYAVHHCLPVAKLREWRNWQRGMKKLRTARYDHLFQQTDENLFIGMSLDFCYKNSGLERIADEVRRAFTFPAITDEKNREGLRLIESCESVAIHARRGDMMHANYGYYATGYFRRAVSYIRRHTARPVFFIFCDPGSVEWARANGRTLGLDFQRDEIHFVDWNKGADSFRDMQLMAACKHQVITNSTFGWWATYFNDNPDKITCSPVPYLNTTHTF